MLNVLLKENFVFEPVWKVENLGRPIDYLSLVEINRPQRTPLEVDENNMNRGRPR